MLAGPASMVAEGGVLLSGNATMQTQAIMEATAFGIFDAQSIMSSFVIFTETGVEILGEEWSIIPEGSESWDNVIEGSEVWSVVSEGSEDWNEQ
jgi:hypothetical protein